LKHGSVASSRKLTTYQCDENVVREGETPMKNVEFDAFGEPMLQSQALPAQPHGSVSRWMVRTGTGIFWTLVVVIVAARAAYFNPGFADKIAQLSDVARSALSILGV
jgi:hypothetical protein